MCIDTLKFRGEYTYPDVEGATSSQHRTCRLPDSFFRIAENADGTGTSSAYLATFYYNADGTPESLLRGMTNPTSDYVYTVYGHDPVQRPTSIVDQFSDGASANVARTFAWNPAGQIVSETRDNDLYAWTSHVAADAARSPAAQTSAESPALWRVFRHPRRRIESEAG